MKAIVVCAAVLSMGIAGSAYALQLQVVNKSKSSIHHLYVSPANQKSWGPDQLGSESNDVVAPGTQFNLHGIEAGNYDVKLTTEDGTECEVDDVEFDESKQWVITEHMLDKCD
jgi:hypothetical protein